MSTLLTKNIMSVSTIKECGLIVPLIFANSIAAFAETTQAEDVTAQMIVTAEYYHRDQAPAPTAADIIVSHESRALTITRLERLEDDRSPVQMFLLVDNCSDFDPGSAADELREFIRSQPPGTTIGSAYIQDGRVGRVREPSQDRELLINSLTPPSGCSSAGPYVALSELINAWKQGVSRRIVILISNGIDPEVKPGYESDSAEAALEAAQRTGVIVYAIYHPSRHFGLNTSGIIHSGQVLLAHLAAETGGQAYFSGPGPLLSVAPFMSDIDAHLSHQYRLEFTLCPNESTGPQTVRVRSTNLWFELAAPTRVWLPEVKPQLFNLTEADYSSQK
jgi:hypothetical protein